MKRKNEYSNFVLEKVFAMHESVLNYLEDIGNEEKFLDMQDVVERCKVAVPETIYLIVREFVRQYLETDLYGVSVSEREGVEFDFEKYIMVKENSEAEKRNVDEDWNELRRIYDTIAMEYFRPVLLR